MQNPATIKRIKIISITFLIFGVIFFLFYLITKPVATCFDKKQNQAEKGIDCGGSCSPCEDIVETQNMIVTETAVIFGGNNKYDVVAKITNPNDSLGASFFKYNFNLKDADGNIIGTHEGTDFILPADSKYVVQFELQTENDIMPVGVDFIINDIKWEKLNDIGKPQIGVYRKNIGANSMNNGIEVSGLIRNDSKYDLGKISIVIILRSEKGDIIGVNKTEKNTVRTREERDFLLTWPYQLVASVQNIEVDAQSNVFDPANLIYSIQ